MTKKRSILTWIALLAGGCGASAAPAHDLLLCAIINKDYVIGLTLDTENGIFRRADDGSFQHIGVNFPGIYNLAIDPRDPRVFYAASMNGCLRSSDGGVTWRITTSWDVPEARDVRVDPNSPDHIYLAVPDGIDVSADGGATWTRREKGLPDRGKYTQAIEVDRTRAGRVLAGCESGIYLTEDGALSWRRVLPAKATVDDIEQSPHDPKLWIAVTQGDGAQVSRDGGLTWEKFAGVPDAQALYNVAFDGTNPRRYAIASWTYGVLVTEDGGLTWVDRNAGLPAGHHVFRVGVDPDTGRLYASIYEDELYISDDFGRTWRRDGLEGSRIYNFNFVPREAWRTMMAKADAIILPPPVPVVPPPAVTAFRWPVPPRTVVQGADERRAAYLARIDAVLAWSKAQEKPADPATTNLPALLAMLARRDDTALCSRRVIELMKDPGSGPFWMLPVVGIAYLGRDQLPADARAAIRNAWRTGMQVRGDTENHWAMYYTSLYLMSQLYPNEPGSSWYTGNSSEENLADARDYLLHWMDLTTTIGQGEFNPTGYITEYSIPMLFLATWARDPAMRQRAHMTLDWLFADFAAHSLNGELSAPNARTTDTAVIEHWNDKASFYGWLLFGIIPPLPFNDGFGVYFSSVAKNYELPEVIYRIAVDRDGDYVQRDLKRTRRRWRNSDVLMAPIYKTTYMRRDYVVGSFQGGGSDPIQTHVWDVTWAVRDPRAAHNTMFSLHPMSSAYDMQTYFSELPDPMVKRVTQEKKPFYDSPDKFLGGSRFEQVFQDLDTVVALYDIPPGTRFPHINGFFSRDLAGLTEDKSGWIFARGGNAYLAYRPLAPYSWAPTMLGDRRLYSPRLKNGTIVQAASADEFRSFGEFEDAIKALPLTFTLEPVPTVAMRTLRGKSIVFTYDQAPVIDGAALDYSKWKLFEGPYLNAEKGSRKLTITHGRLQRVLDFNTLTISDSVLPAKERVRAP